MRLIVKSIKVFKFLLAISSFLIVINTVGSLISPIERENGVAMFPFALPFFFVLFYFLIDIVKNGKLKIHFKL